jgi:zinc transport system substrate-binding protein
MRQLILLFSLLVSSTLGAEPLSVFVSLLPQQTFVERLGGPDVVVESLVKPGFSPHTYEPTPSQIARLAEADLFVGIGLPFESAWMERLRAANPNMWLLDLSDGIERRVMEAHDHHHDHHAHDQAAPAQAGSELDPHLWTSPRLVRTMGERIAAVLTELDPAHASDYAARLATFQVDLEALDADIRAQLNGLKHRRFMVYHPAWGYFADVYGLTQIPIELDGKEPGPRQLAALIDQARKQNVKVIFVQPQFSRKAAEQVARAIDGRVEAIDNLAPDYFENLRRVAQAIAASER